MQNLTSQQLLRTYLDKEHQDKRKKPFDFTGWTDYVPVVRFQCASLHSAGSSPSLHTGHTTTGKLLRLRRVYMPVYGNAVARRGRLCIRAEGHALPAHLYLDIFGVIGKHVADDPAIWTLASTVSTFIQ